MITSYWIGLTLSLSILPEWLERMTCRMKALRRWRRMAIAALLGLSSLWAVAGPSPQSEPEDRTRRIWNERFREARDRAGARRPRGAALKWELIGVTIWRLRDDQDKPTAERATADTLFAEGERLRLSIEAPRRSDSYLYVIDREVYADGSTSDPYLIFPSQTTPEGGNVVTAGKPVFIPARGDEFPYFIMERARKDQIREELTIIISPKSARNRSICHLGRRTARSSWRERKWRSGRSNGAVAWNGGKNEAEQANSGLLRREKPIEAKGVSCRGIHCRKPFTSSKSNLERR